MAILRVGPFSTYQSIAAAMLDAGPADTIVLEDNYGNENADVRHNGMTITGDAGSLGVTLRLAPGVTSVSLTGLAPFNLLDSVDGNAIVGNDGDNEITVTGGADAVDGGLGNDRLTVDYALAIGNITGDSTSNFAEAGGGARLVTITDGTIEHFTILTGSGADTITTGNGNDIIRTGNGASTVSAGQGANIITGGVDADTITALDGGNLIDAGDGANTVTTGGGNDSIVTGTGADTIVSGAGIDRITVRGGADTVDSGADLDRLVVDYSAVTTNVLGGVTGGLLSAGYSGRIANSSGDSIDFVEVEAFDVTTGSGNDSIATGGASDFLNGAAGNDTLSSGDGTDTVIGGTGDDFIFGGSSAADLHDMMYGGDGNDSIDGGAGNDNLNGGFGIDTVIGGQGSDTLIGNGNNDLLGGGGGSDLIYGNDGDDFLNGGFAFDRLNGGAGADKFYHEGVAGHGSDWVQDYSAAEGDLLACGLAGATESQFQVSFATTSGAGSAGVAEAFVIYSPTGQILWALVDGGDDMQINLLLGGQVFDLLA